MPEQAQLKVVNRPEFLPDTTSDKLDELINNLTSYLESKVFKAVQSLTVAVVFNYPISRTLKGSPEVLDGKTNLWVVNYPADFDLKRNIELATTKGYVNGFKGLFDDVSSVQRVDLILLFNKPYSALKLEESATKEAAPAEEGLSVFVPIHPRYKLERVVLNDNLIAQIKSALKVLDKTDLIYKIWGFSEIEPAPKAILNFYGPPGTGKTMAAHAVAHFMDSKLLALNYADIESKYVGVAPKNLVKAFETAQKEKTILFFDEADSFLGKRISNVTSNADQSVNSLRSQMLMLLDNFSGIVIFATNLIENYDSAFESRIFKHLLFEMPNAINRKKIISLTLPPRLEYENGVPFTSEELDELVDISDGFSGRYIKNAILAGLTNAVADERNFVRYSDFLESFEQTRTTIDALKNATSKESKLKIDSKIKHALEQKIQEKLTESNGVVIGDLDS